MSGFTLDGKPVDDKLPEGWGQSQQRVGRIGDWSRDQSPRDTPERDREGAELYTGGERSGLAVQNPDERGGRPDLVENILSQAARSGPPSKATSPVPWGSGHTLGSDETPSQPVFDDAGEEIQRRTLTFWRNGFSIEAGPLHPYDVPESKALLEAIQQGRAPTSLFGVRFGQPLEVVVNERRGEDYVPQKRATTPFEGDGHRLGNIVPDIAGTPAGDHNIAVQQQQENEMAAQEIKPDVDESRPVTNVQLRLANGGRRVVKINLDATIGELRRVAEPAANGRPFVLQTPFPVRELKDEETIEAAKLANSVVVQRLT